MPLTSDHFVNYQKEVGDFCVCNGTTIDLPGDFARKIFSECLYTNTDLISFIVGLSSLGFWMVAQAPQFILNCKLGRAKGLSLCFLLEWLTGDTLNLAGAFLTGQVGTAISTAILFVGMDMMLASQYLLLERPCIKNYHSDDDDDDEEEENGYGDELDNPLLSPDQKLPSRPPPTRALYSVFLPVVLLSSLLVGSLGLYGGGGGVSGGGSSSSGGGGGMTTLMEVALARGARNVGGSVRGGGRSLLPLDLDLDLHHCHSNHTRVMQHHHHLWLVKFYHGQVVLYICYQEFHKLLKIGVDNLSKVFHLYYLLVPCLEIQRMH